MRLHSQEGAVSTVFHTTVQRFKNGNGLRRWPTSDARSHRLPMLQWLQDYIGQANHKFGDEEVAVSVGNLQKNGGQPQ